MPQWPQGPLSDSSFLWRSLLVSKGGYQGNILEQHADLTILLEIDPSIFLCELIVDQRFGGSRFASSVARCMFYCMVFWPPAVRTWAQWLSILGAKLARLDLFGGFSEESLERFGSYDISSSSHLILFRLLRSLPEGFWASYGRLKRPGPFCVPSGGAPG